MKKLLILFSVLLIIFMGVWVFKQKTPVNRPEDSEVTQPNSPWWENAGAAPVASAEWTLDPEIPENYIPVPGEKELYMVVDDSGNITSYRHRSQQEDESWLWETVNPDIPDNYQAVEGLENIYKVTNTDGSASYYKYLRNNDDTFAFVPVDENGNEIVETDNSEAIPENYVHVSGNVYAVYNEHGVLIGYKERRVDEDGNYTWKDAEKPQEKEPEQTTSDSHNNNGTGGGTGNGTGNGIGNGGTGNGSSGDSNQVIYQDNGNYTQTETIVSTETTGGWIITYQTIVTRTFSAQGELISTKKDGPTEISKIQVGAGGSNAPDTSKIAASLSAEYARVCVGLSYDNSLANNVLTAINAERTAAGASALSLNASTDAYKLAATRAADMATYDHADYDSAMYGTLAEMCEKFNIGASAPTELVWKTSAGKSADAIASRLQVMSGSILSSGAYSSVGLSIISKGGYYYINMVLL